MSAHASKSTFIANHRNTVIALAVLLFHGLAIWALQSGLLMRAVEVVVPVEILAQIVDLPATQVAPAPKPSEPVKQEMNKPKPAAQVSRIGMVYQ